MKILRINTLGYVAGGAENGIAKINPYLLNKGHSVKILASDLGSEQEHFNEYVFKSISDSSRLKVFLFLFNPSAFFSLKKALNEYKPDIVHLHAMCQITPSVLFLLRKYPTVMTLHGPESFLSKFVIWCMKTSYFKDNICDEKNLTIGGRLTHFYFNHIQKFVYKFGLKNVDLFIAPSKYIQNMAKTDVSPIIHLPNFIELGKFHELRNNYNLLFVGRLEKAKGVEFLIEAISLIIKKFPRTTLTIIGNGRNMTDLLNLAKKMQIEKYIQFTGWVKNKDIASYYEKASIVVIPSVWPENFPTVCNEAMSAGRPVIGTNVGGIPELIDDGVDGYLVEPENSEQIAEKVVKLFSDEKSLVEFGANARKRAEELSIEKYVEKMEKIYERVLKKEKISCL